MECNDLQNVKIKFLIHQKKEKTSNILKLE